MENRGHCTNCGRLIETMCFKGEKWCSDDCRKAIVFDEEGRKLTLKEARKRKKHQRRP